MTLLDYKSRLIKLNLLPLMMFYELCDIIFYIKSVKSPNTNFNINDFIFVKKSITRSSSHKLIHSISSTSHVNHFYFNRLQRLWNPHGVLYYPYSTYCPCYLYLYYLYYCCYFSLVKHKTVLQDKGSSTSAV